MVGISCGKNTLQFRASPFPVTLFRPRGVFTAFSAEMQKMTTERTNLGGFLEPPAEEMQGSSFIKLEDVKKAGGSMPCVIAEAPLLVNSFGKEKIRVKLVTPDGMKIREFTRVCITECGNAFGANPLIWKEKSVFLKVKVFDWGEGLSLIPAPVVVEDVQ